jgi:hypothetical protein
MWWRMMYVMGLYTPVKLKSVKDENDEYIEPLKKRFLEIFDSNTDYNENIGDIFYEKSEFDKCVQDGNNELEKIWRTRILWENTPRGNIMMFYDAYKMGFSFFCDQKVISYDVLNAVAMKYVKIYRCRDFFIDESITPKEKSSPLISVHFPEEIIKKPNKTTNKTKSPFATLRDYTKENPNSKIPILSKKEPEYKKNTFLYLGKMNNFQILQKQPKSRKVLAKFTSPLLDYIVKDSGIKREAFSYKQFKHVKENQIVQEMDLTD